MKKLRVLPRGGVLVPRHESILSGQKEFIGRKYDASHGDHGGGGWPVAVSPASPVEVPSNGDLELWHQYRAEVIAGALWAADEATAKECGVEFDPKFGGEFDAAPAAPAAGSSPDPFPSHGA